MIPELADQQPELSMAQVNGIAPRMMVGAGQLDPDKAAPLEKFVDLVDLSASGVELGKTHFDIYHVDELEHPFRSPQDEKLSPLNVDVEDVVSGRCFSEFAEQVIEARAIDIDALLRHYLWIDLGMLA
jgi:hypothetical protein